MGEHAKLSPSASERWISCPASIRMEGLVPPKPESVYAAEGTLAHTLGELKASLAFGKISQEEFDTLYQEWASSSPILTPEVIAEMEIHTNAYVALIRERVELFPNSVVMFEERLDTGVPGCWGTSDTVIVSPIHVEVIDFKYGAGVAVEAHGNSQLRLYAVGALDEYGDMLGDTELIRITVHQPRMDHTLTEEMTPQALRDWRDSLIPIAEEAFRDDARFGPSDQACRWCPATGRCKAQLEDVFSLDYESSPDTLSPQKISDTLPRLKMIRDWLTAFEAAALDTAYSQNLIIPGYKVVKSGGVRKVNDSEAAADALSGAGYLPEEFMVEPKVRGIGDLEKLLGAEQFKALLETPGIVTKTEGKPALVMESDKRPSINPNSEAAAVFAEEDI